jgi:streptomycin 6-kinase
LSRQLYSDDNHMVLHGDIHHFNVMQNSDGKWLSLDPKGILGPRAYDYSNIFCNPCKNIHIVANEKNMALVRDVVCERSGIAPDIIMAHAFTRAAQVAAWCLDDNDRPYWLACAKIARSFL